MFVKEVQYSLGFGLGPETIRTPLQQPLHVDLNNVAVIMIVLRHIAILLIEGPIDALLSKSDSVILLCDLLDAQSLFKVEAH